MINTAQRSKLVPRISGPGALVYAGRLAPASRNYVILRSLSRKVVAKHRRYYSVVEVTVQNKYTRLATMSILHRGSKRIAGGCSRGSYAALLAAASKQHFVRKTRLVWSAVAAAARARRSGALEQPLGCWKGGPRTP